MPLMARGSRERTLWLIVVVFAVGMAWVESATVYYLRALTDRIEPYQPNPLPIAGVFGAVELVREAATLLMLGAVGMLAGTTWRKRAGYSAIAFGVWDILYYVFLRIMCGWPRSLFDWDVLFLLPLPWWGPVLAPLSIAVLMIAWGTFATQSSDRGAAAAVPWTVWGLGGLGTFVALYLFMADSLLVVHQGIEMTRQVLPTSFNWAVFCVALVLMAAPVAHQGWRLQSRS
jgi:hypothetical protein